jgi:D-tyrosyl-tRNA(Tyr) deacylase
MIVVIQKVSEANVTIEGNLKSSIQNGLLILLGIGHDDDVDDINWLIGKISKLRIFQDQEDKMNLSLEDIKAEVLVVSQFTLLASTKKGNRPSFINAAPPEKAIPLYETFISQLSTVLNQPVKTGTFGADMKVALINDGPVTIIIDSKNKV